MSATFVSVLLAVASLVLLVAAHQNLEKSVGLRAANGAVLLAVSVVLGVGALVVGTAG